MKMRNKSVEKCVPGKRTSVQECSRARRSLEHLRAWTGNQGVSVGDKSLKAKAFRIRALGARIQHCDKLGVVHRSAILALRKWRQDDQEFKTIVS